VLLKQLGEVVILHARIGGAGQREDPGPDLLSEASGRGPATVPMGEGREALLAQADEEPADCRSERRKSWAASQARRAPAWTRVRT